MTIPDRITRKLQELSFALLRVAAHIRRYEMRKTLERLTYHLIENVSYQNTELSFGSINAIRNFIILGKNIYEIEPVNAKILERELELLAGDLKLFSGVTNIEDLNTSFTKELKINRTQNQFEGSAGNYHNSQGPDEVIIDDFEINYGDANTGTESIDIHKKDNNTAIGNTANKEDGNAEMRKEKLYVMISTAPEKRLALKEIVAAFPSVSERTIRYDLKKLGDEGRIIRQGSGGPSSYYTVQMSLSNPSVLAVKNV